MSLSPGSRIGPYQILETIGAGGMGEVYRARDTRLNRDVAVKVLPDLFASDPERLARFTREAQTLAALNHPNIAHIHGLEESGATRALVMELVDGVDLAMIIGRGPMPIVDVIPIAKQIADALEAAHEQGIIHRDLKPANVKVKPDGTVKVLDFGLAKALGPDGPGATAEVMNSPTLTARATQMGMVLGTAAYMSPEQARGRPVDRRADIWAFGGVLYEMLTGRRAFEGDDVSITLANVLKDEPKWAELPAGLPAPIARMLRRCLEKDPRKRLSAIGDARLELEEQDAIRDGSVARPVAMPTRPSVLSRLWPAAIGMLVTAALAYALWPSGSAGQSAALARFSMLPPAGERLYPDSTGVTVSPDGTMVAFIIGAVARSEAQLWVRSIHSLSARKLDDSEGASLPFWSPDSRRIGFFTRSKLKIIAAAGGRAETIADAPGGRGGTWNESNIIVFAPDAGGPLYRVSATGGTPEPVTALDAKEYGHRMPVFLPDGQRFLYAALPSKNGKFDIFAGSLASRERTFIASMEAAPVYADPGWLLYARQGVLTALPFDSRALKIAGDPVTLEDEPSSILDPATSFTAGRSVSVSRTGSVAYYSAPSLNTVATWYDGSGAQLGALNVPAGHYETISISPDGTRGVMVRSTSPSESSLWLVDMARGGATPLSSGPGRNDNPVWSPDGTRVVWASDRDGMQKFYVKNVNDGGPEQMLFGSDTPFKNPSAWSPDGRWITFTQLDPGAAQNIYVMDASGSKDPTVFIQGAARETGGPLSPDGRWMAHVSDGSGRFQLYVQSFPTPGRTTQISDQGAVLAWWSGDGRQLFFVDDNLRSLWRVDVQTGPTFGVGTPRQIGTLPPEIVWVDAMPDRQRFLAIAPERTGTGSMTVVQNWPAALASR